MNINNKPRKNEPPKREILDDVFAYPCGSTKGFINGNGVGRLDSIFAWEKISQNSLENLIIPYKI